MEVKGLNEVNIFRTFGDYSNFFPLPSKLSVECHSQGQTGCVCALVAPTPLNPPMVNFQLLFCLYWIHFHALLCLWHQCVGESIIKKSETFLLILFMYTDADTNEEVPVPVQRFFLLIVGNIIDENCYHVSVQLNHSTKASKTWFLKPSNDSGAEKSVSTFY